MLIVIIIGIYNRDHGDNNNNNNDNNNNNNGNNINNSSSHNDKSDNNSMGSLMGSQFQNSFRPMWTFSFKFKQRHIYLFEVWDSRVKKSSYEIKLRKMMTHFELGT